MAAALIGLLASPWAASAQGCPSDNVSDVLKDPRVQEALADAWADSHEGQPDEHEEGGWIYQCRMSNGDGTFRYYTDPRRWPPGSIDGIHSTPSRPSDPDCRLVADFHTHPGGGVTADGRPENPGADGPHNWEASPEDRRESAENGIPGIIRYGSGDHTIDFTYGYNGMEAPRDPSWDCPGQDGSAGSGAGDPHVVTFDGRTFDLQSIGTFVYVTSARGDFAVHVQQQPYKDLLYASVNTAVAVRDGNDRVEWSIDRPDPLLNGVARPLAIGDQMRLRSRAVVRRSADGYLFVSSVGDRVTVIPSSGIMVDFYVRPASHRRGTLRGLLGNFDGDPDNDLQTAEGRTVTLKAEEAPDATHPFYAVFAESWRVPAAGGLIGRTLTTAIDPRTFPQRQPAVSAEAIAAARARCTQRGVSDLTVREACAFDVAATGNDAFALSAERANKAAVLRLEAVGRLIAIDTDVSGMLDGREARALFAVRLDPGTYTFDSTGSERTSWTLASPGGKLLVDAPQGRVMGEDPLQFVIATPGVHKITVSVRFEMLDGTYRFRLRKVPGK
jgi:hypothetical protein